MMREERIPHGCCDPEEIFDLAEGTLSPERRHFVRGHLDSCSECAARYRREVALSEGFSSGIAAGVAAPSGPALKGASSVGREVAMCLPTRSLVARLMWGALAVGILIVTTLALSFGGENPIFILASGVESLFGYISAASNVSTLFLALVAPFVLVALGVGFFVDLLIAGAVYSLVRGTRSTEHTREA
ncbi:anti-sigma factor family protein [Rubrobacter indicoceani]|uniref:anti-sigma factor family protein n=1 Tax=Rubrobacter indicoceani TaxID=2051957 RepID=UPI000E5B85E7|nr:zf-HC2 domain-containing protein [Rubrobacter indicoceani]